MTALRVIAYLAGVLASYKYAPDYFVVGPVFAAVVLLFSGKWALERPARAAAYVAASTAIYALVYFISGLDFGKGSPVTESFLGPFPAAVVAGSVLLPAAHVLIIGGPRTDAWRAAAWLTGCFYLITLAAFAAEQARPNLGIPWLFILIAVWQGTYLKNFFGRRAVQAT